MVLTSRGGRGQRNANVRPGPEPRGFLKFIIKSHKTKCSRRKALTGIKQNVPGARRTGTHQQTNHISDLTLRTPYSARDNMCRGVYPRHAPSTACTGAVLAVDARKILSLKKMMSSCMGGSAVCSTKHPTCGDNTSYAIRKTGNM